MQLPIDSIKIGPRIRKDFGDIQALADSLSRHGQIQPIVVDKDNFLIAGERRLTAAKELGWTHIEAIPREDLDDVGKMEIELEENIRRKEFSWPEEVVGLSDLYDLRQGRYGRRTQGSDGAVGYGIKDAAMELDRSTGSVSMDLQLAKAIRDFPELCKEKSKVAAFKRYRVLRENALRREIAARTRQPEVLEETPASQEEEAESPNGDAPRVPIRKAGFKGHGLIYLGDSTHVLRSMPDESVDCLITDPPFGLGLFKAGDESSDRRLAHSAGHMYDDDPYKVINMLDNVFAQCARVLKRDGHAYVFFHHNRYQDILDMLERHFGDCVEPTPLVWIKNTPGIGEPNRNWVFAYEACFFINRGRPMAKPQQFNWLQYATIPPKTKIHPTEKPVLLLKHLVQASCVQGEIVLDPFAGSGSTLVAAIQQGCRFIGVELEEPFYNRIVDRVSLELGGLADAVGDA